MLLIFLVVTFQPPTIKAEPADPAARYYQLGLEATDWITSFQLTPPNTSTGIPYQDQRAWGLDPFYFDNGTITAGTAGIRAGERQSLAFLIGGHDAGLGASAALDAYIQTGDSRYLSIFKIYFDYFQNSQIPASRSSTLANVVENVSGREVTLDNAGVWAEQADVAAGPDKYFGTPDDMTSLLAVYPSPEHGNPIAASLISYYRLTNDSRALQMLNRYGSWLVITQVKSGNYSGAFPVTQYYWALGWKPRMFETTESTWILAELYLLTGNRTYLQSAVAGGEYMLLRQFTSAEWVDTPVYGALPYEWNETRYTTSVLTNHAGFALLAWAQLFRLTGDQRFLAAAEKYANWLLSFQVTPNTTSWGNHTYANDSMAVGGYYYGYDTEKHRFGSKTELSLWSAAYSIRGLLFLTQLTGNEEYLSSALLAADWLTRMRYPDNILVPLQALATTKYTASSWWGLYPQFYQPDMSEIEKAGIPSFVDKGRINLQAIMDKNLTWFERTFGVDFNLIDYQMASRGLQYMKMIWSWWPNLGFEPRYGGDIAFGAFSIGNYLTFKEELDNLKPVLNEISELTSDQTLGLPENFTTSYHQAEQIVATAELDFNTSWYTAAIAELREASTLAQNTIRNLRIITPALQRNRTVLLAIPIALTGIALYYFFAKLRKSSASRRRRRPRRGRRSLSSR